MIAPPSARWIDTLVADAPHTGVVGVWFYAPALARPPVVAVIAYGVDPVPSRDPELARSGVRASVWSAPADQRRVMRDGPAETVADCAAAVIGWAWRVGALDVRQALHGPVTGDWREPMHGIAHWACDSLYAVAGQPLETLGDTAVDIGALAARHGYYSWLAKPAAWAGDMWRPRWIADDPTLASDGTRSAVCSAVPMMPRRAAGDHEQLVHLYRLGQRRGRG